MCQNSMGSLGLFWGTLGASEGSLGLLWGTLGGLLGAALGFLEASCGYLGIIFGSCLIRDRFVFLFEGLGDEFGLHN